MADIAYNPKTGEAVRLEGGQWVPAEVAKNTKTGEIVAFDGQSWTKVGAPERGTGERVQRGVGLAAQGMNDAVAGTLGAPVDLVNRGLSAVGMGSDRPVGGSQMFRDALDYIGSQGAKALGYEDTKRLTPETTGEKFIYGGARGIGDAVSMLAGAGALKAASVPGGLTSRVAGVLTEAPVTQVVASGIGSGVGEATGSPLAGIGTTLAIGMAPSLARAAAAPQVGRLTPQQQQYAAALQAEGIPLTTGQQTGSRPIQYLESALANLPMSSGMAQRQNQQQLSKLTEAVVKRAGMAGDDAGPAALAAQRGNLGQQYGAITGRNTVVLDTQLVNDVTATMAKYGRKVEPTKRGIVQDYVDALTQGGRMAGDVYQETRSLLGNQAQGFKSSDYATFRALKDIRNALDQAMERSVSPADAQAWKTLNRQYGNLKTIEKAMEGAGADVAAGKITPARLQMATKQSARGSYAAGQGDLNELAHASGALMKPLPDSGTAQRGMWTAALTGGAGLTAGAGNPALAAALVSLPPAVQKALQSDAVKTWLTRQRAQGADMTGLLAALLAERAIALPPPQGR